MISFSNLYEAVDQQPTPPQPPVQNTGEQVTQQPEGFNQKAHDALMSKFPDQYGSLTPEQQISVQQYYQQKYGDQTPEEPSGLFGKIKAGYNFINDKYEAGKSIAKDYGGALLPTLGSLGMMAGYRVPGTLGAAMLYGGMGINMLGTMNMAAKRMEAVSQQRNQQQMPQAPQQQIRR